MKKETVIPTDWQYGFLKIRTAAKIADMSEKALRNHIDRGTGPQVSRPSERIIRIKGEDLARWLQGKKEVL